MMYFWAVVAVLIIWGIARAIRWWNLPAVAEARSKRAIERQKQRTERLKIRRRMFWKQYYEENRNEFPSPDYANFDDMPTPDERRWRLFGRRHIEPPTVDYKNDPNIGGY